MEKVKAWNSLTCVRMSKNVANQENTLNKNKYVFPESHPETNYSTNNEGPKKYSIWLCLLMSKCFRDGAAQGLFWTYSEHCFFLLYAVSLKSLLAKQTKWANFP